MLTICTFKWGRKYGALHVKNLEAMLRRHGRSTPFEFVLISDDPKDQKLCDEMGIRYVPLWEEMRHTNNCGVRLKAFDPAMREVLGDRVMWIDLDVVITGDINHILQRTEPMVACRAPAAPLLLNGSIVMRDWDAHNEIYTKWTDEDYHLECLAYDERVGLRRVVSDEIYMSAKLTDKGVMLLDKVDGVYNFRRHLDNGNRPLPANAKIVVMNGGGIDPSSPALQARCPWIARYWYH